MGERTKIDWCDATFNPWWGCQHAGSPACDNCYARAIAKRFHQGCWGPDGERRRFGGKHWTEPQTWNKRAERDGTRPRVFCGSMCDVFELRSEVRREQFALFDLIADTPHLDWLLLTKRPQNIMLVLEEIAGQDELPPNVWLGVTVENQEAADERLPILFQIPAALYFVSCEPLLEPVNLAPALGAHGYTNSSSNRLGWVIAGCESGARARPTQDDWLRALRDQCEEASTPFFLKQQMCSGELVKMPELDGQVWGEVPTS